MAELFWPGESRAAALMSDESLLAAMIGVERTWLASLHRAGLALATEPVRVGC